MSIFVTIFSVCMAIFIMFMLFAPILGFLIGLSVLLTDVFGKKHHVKYPGKD